MARKKYPPIKAIGVRPNGQTPPEDMTPEEQYEFMYNESVIAAKAIGAVPKVVSADERKKEAVV